MVHATDVVTLAVSIVFAAWAFAIHLCRDGGLDGAGEAGAASD